MDRNKNNATDPKLLVSPPSNTSTTSSTTRRKKSKVVVAPVVRTKSILKKTGKDEGTRPSSSRAKSVGILLPIEETEDVAIAVQDLFRPRPKKKGKKSKSVSGLATPLPRVALLAPSKSKSRSSQLKVSKRLSTPRASSTSAVTRGKSTPVANKSRSLSVTKGSSNSLPPVKFLPTSTTKTSPLMAIVKKMKWKKMKRKKRSKSIADSPTTNTDSTGKPTTSSAVPSTSLSTAAAPSTSAYAAELANITSILNNIKDTTNVTVNQGSREYFRPFSESELKQLMDSVDKVATIHQEAQPPSPLPTEKSKSKKKKRMSRKDKQLGIYYRETESWRLRKAAIAAKTSKSSATVASTSTASSSNTRPLIQPKVRTFKSPLLQTKTKKSSTHVTPDKQKAIPEYALESDLSELDLVKSAIFNKHFYDEARSLEKDDGPLKTLGHGEREKIIVDAEAQRLRHSLTNRPPSSGVLPRPPTTSSLLDPRQLFNSFVFASVAGGVAGAAGRIQRVQKEVEKNSQDHLTEVLHAQAVGIRPSASPKGMTLGQSHVARHTTSAHKLAQVVPANRSVDRSKNILESSMAQNDPYGMVQMIKEEDIRSKSKRKAVAALRKTHPNVEKQESTTTTEKPKVIPPSKPKNVKPPEDANENNSDEYDDGVATILRHLKRKGRFLKNFESTQKAVDNFEGNGIVDIDLDSKRKP